MNYDIAYIVSHGFAARMVTQTNLLGKLVKRGNKVALISPDKNDPNLKDYCQQHGVSLYEFNESGKLSNQHYIFKRKYYLEDLRSNPALWEKHIYATRYNRSMNPFTHIWPRYYGFVYWLRKEYPSIKERFQRNEKKYLQSEKAKQLIEYINPEKLVSTYPVNFNEATLLHYGNQSETTETWIHLLSWDNITCKGHFPELASKYIAWGPIMKQELQEYYGISEDRILECGVPHFDVHVEAKKHPNYKDYLISMGLDPEISYLFFAMSSPRFAPKEIEIVEWLAKKVSKQEFKHPLQLIVRPHPQNVQGHMADQSWLPRLKRLNQLPSVAIDYPEMAKSKLNWSMNKTDMERLAQLITGSSIVLNSGSTICIDALMHNKPVILTSFDAEHKLPYWKSARRLLSYTHLNKIVELGGVEVVKSFQLLENMIVELVQNPLLSYDRRKFTLSKQSMDNGSLSTDAVTAILSK